MRGSTIKKSIGDNLSAKRMILQGDGHPISPNRVCYTNDSPKVGYMAPALALDLTTSRRGHLRSISYINTMGFVWGGVGRALMQFMHFLAIFAML